MVSIDCQRYIYFVVFSSWMSTLFHMMNKLYRIITGANWFWLTLVRELHLNIICSSLHDDSKGNRSIICSERICLLLLSLFIEFSDMNVGSKWGTYLGAFYVELYTYLVKPYKGTWVSCIFFLSNLSKDQFINILQGHSVTYLKCQMETYRTIWCLVLIVVLYIP